MESHKQIIKENLSAEEFADLTFEFLFKITNESERGAVLIGGSKIDEYLENLIIKILPSDSKTYRNKLLKYPGPLGSFSGKIELLYAFRIIDKRLYNSLNVLRKIRNDAAHTSNDFSIQSIKNKLDEIYDFEDGFNEFAKQIAFKNLIHHKKEVLKKGLQNKQITDIDPEALWNERVPHPEKDETIKKHLTIWKFSYGMVFLCLKIHAIGLSHSNSVNNN